MCVWDGFKIHNIMTAAEMPDATKALSIVWILLIENSDSNGRNFFPSCRHSHGHTLEMKTGYAWETDREAAAGGKKVLRHSCFSSSSESRMVSVKLGCCFCYLCSG